MEEHSTAVLKGFSVPAHELAGMRRTGSDLEELSVAATAYGPDSNPYPTRLFWVPIKTFPSAAIGVAK